MAKKTIGRSRRRHAKENATANAVLDGAAKAAAQERVLGTQVTASVPNESLFVVDRSRISKAEVQSEIRAQAKAEDRERRRSRPNRAELTLTNATRLAPVPVNVPGRKKKRGVAGVALSLIEKRSFKSRKPAPKAPGFRMDVWATDLAATVASEKSGERRRIERKMNAAVRAAKPVLKPSDGLSVNPAFEAHQDTLGEAVAGILDEQLDKELAKKKMSFDRRIVEVCAEEERKAAEEEEKEDVMEDGVEEEREEEEVLPRTVPQRKSRTMRNREKRRKASDYRRDLKIARHRMRYDLEHLESIAEEAIREADKLNGETKRRMLEANPPVAPGEEEPLHKEIAKEKVRTEAQSVPVPLSEDLSTNMRTVKMPQSNSVLRDRFLSFERRGIVEPTGVLKKEKKQAEQEKRAHELRDRPRKNKRGSRSKISYWRQGGKK